MCRPRFVRLTLIAALSACGPSTTAPPDAGAPADAATPDTPSIPWLATGAPPIVPPTLTPCPTNWRELTSPDGITTCHPYPDTGRPDCPLGQAAFTTDPDCAPVGPPCPADGRVADLPTDQIVLHVLAGATGGDGSPTSPYSNLRDVPWSTLARNTLVAIGRGDYDQEISTRDGVSVWGACVAETIVRSSSPAAMLGVVEVAGADVELRGFRIGASARPGVVVAGSGRSAHLEGLWVEEAQPVGVVAALPSTLTAHELVVTRTQPTSTGDFGDGMTVQRSATATLDRIVLSSNRNVAISIAGADATATLSDIAVVDTQSFLRRGDLGQGLVVAERASAEVERALLRNNRSIAVYVDDPVTMLRMTDTVIEDTQPNESTGLVGRGLSVERGAAATVTRTHLVRNHQNGAFLINDDSTLDLSDSVIRDTLPNITEELTGTGLNVENGSTRVARTLVEASRGIGMQAVFGAALDASDLVVRNVQPTTTAVLGGHGVVVLSATANIERLHVSDTHEVGVIVWEDSTATLTDVLCEDVASRQRDDRIGSGIVAFGGIAELTRTVVRRVEGSGLAARGGGTLNAVALTVTDIERAACADLGTCPGSEYGLGVATFVGGRTTLTDFLVRAVPLCGLLVGNMADLDASSGVVRDNAIGTCVADDSYDVSRVMRDVQYIDNGTNLQAQSLPVPEPVDMFDPR